MKPTRIIIDPTSRILYSAFYIKGLYEFFGRQNVTFGRKHFKHLEHKQQEYAFEHYFAFVSISDKKITRFVVDYCDPPDINLKAYDWCDVYAKINYDKDATGFDKLVVIPPGFGIKIWNLSQTLFHCINNLLSCRFSIPTKKVTFLKDYYQQYKREILEKYTNNFQKKTVSEKCFVFMIGTLWNDGDYAKNTNEGRKNFIAACRKNPKILFEGGLYATPSHLRYQEYKDFIVTTRYSAPEYVEKTKLSDVVFNTPAVHNCHGWKLAEYLAMGKAIISTKLSYELPIDLSHGKNIHFIENNDEIESSIKIILNDQNYKQLLCKNAENYFSEYMMPHSIIKNIIEKSK